MPQRMNIILPMRALFEELQPLKEELKALDLSPEILLTHILAQWLSYQSDEQGFHHYFDFSILQTLEIYAVEDLLVRRHPSVETCRVGLAVIKHLVQRFLFDIVPIIESFDLTVGHYRSAKVTWVGQSAVLDVLE